jgi:hypothetical protein
VTEPPTVAAARRFAERLDADDFEGVRSMISERCTYDSGRGVLVGPGAIVRSYLDASRHARSKFDQVRYESEVVEADDHTALIEFRDSLSARGERHVHTCRQRVRFAADETIVRIDQVDLPGERRRLEAFCARVGWTWVGDGPRAALPRPRGARHLSGAPAGTTRRRNGSFCP